MRMSSVLVSAVFMAFLIIFLTIVFNGSGDSEATKSETCGQKVALYLPGYSWKYTRNLGCLIEARKGVWVELKHVYLEKDLYLEEVHDVQ